MIKAEFKILKMLEAAYKVNMEVYFKQLNLLTIQECEMILANDNDFFIDDCFILGIKEHIEQRKSDAYDLLVDIVFENKEKIIKSINCLNNINDILKLTNDTMDQDQIICIENDIREDYSDLKEGFLSMIDDIILY